MASLLREAIRNEICYVRGLKRSTRKCTLLVFEEKTIQPLPLIMTFAIASTKNTVTRFSDF